MSVSVCVRKHIHRQIKKYVIVKMVLVTEIYIALD